jgi:hypothetical protein
MRNAPLGFGVEFELCTLFRVWLGELEHAHARHAQSARTRTSAHARPLSPVFAQVLRRQLLWFVELCAELGVARRLLQPRCGGRASTR